MGGISTYKTKAGERWLIKYRVPAPVGERQVLRRGFPDKDEAQEALRAALAEIDKGSHVVPSKLTLGVYLAETWLPALRLKPSIEASYRKNARLHVVPHIGSLPLASVTGQRLTALYRKLETSGRVDGHGGLSARTVRYVHTIVHRALRDAVDDNLLAVNPADRRSRRPQCRPRRPSRATGHRPSSGHS
jgi:hypothetical protein